MSEASAPTLLIEPTSAWVVILAVSLVTLPVVMLARRLMKGGGGAAASLLLTLPLLLPLVAALLYERGVFPEIAVLKPALLRDIAQHPGDLEHLLFMSNGSSDALVPYMLSTSVGGLIVLVGASISAFMLARRLTGAIVVARLVRRCRPLEDVELGRLEKMVSMLAGAAKAKKVPTLLVLPEWECGAFAVGGRRPRILLSRSLLEALDDDELEAVLAHEVAHVATKDMRVLALAGLLRDMTAWNPLSHVALRRLHRDRELEADRLAASITGKPLAVASSLIKMCDLLKTRPGKSPRAALAMLRRRDGLSPRVNNLLALSDGGAIAVRGKMPFLLAGALVLALALQVGSAVSSLQGTTFAIVLGAPQADDTEVWSNAKQNRAPGKVARRVRARHVGPFAAGLAVHRGDLWGWLHAVQRKAHKDLKGPVGRQVVAELRDGWQALPILASGDVGPFGIYRVEPAFAPETVPPGTRDLQDAKR